MTDLVPPQSLDAERAVLGACLMDNRVIDMVRAIVVPDDFYHSKHRRVFDVVCQLADKSEPVDMLTVADALKAQSVPDGGMDLLKNLEAGVPAIANVEVYARRVREKARLRRLIDLCSQFAAQAYQGPEDTQAALDGAAAAFLDLSAGQSETGYSTLAQAAGDAFKGIGDAMGAEEGFCGLSTGFSGLDYYLCGLEPGQLIILAGRPGWGKTALALNIARNVARRAGAVAIFSMETRDKEIATRFLADAACINSRRLKQPRGGGGRAPLNAQEYASLAAAAGMVGQLPIYVYDQSALSLVSLRGQARRLKAQVGELPLIIVDYLQLMDANLRGQHKRQDEVAAISRGLKALAKDLRCTVLALSQLNRAVEGRPDHRPSLADLRESGQIEQDADAVIFIYRPKERDGLSNAAEAIFAKQKDGEIGATPLRFNPETTTFQTVEVNEQSYRPPADPDEPNPPHWQEQPDVF